VSVLATERLSDLRERAARWGLPLDVLTSRLALSIREVAAALGVSKRVVETWHARGLFPNAWQEGAVVRIPLGDVLEFMEVRRVHALRGAERLPVAARARAFLGGDACARG
jgi:excisionase family DNA binding protein